MKMRSGHLLKTRSFPRNQMKVYINDVTMRRHKCAARATSNHSRLTQVLPKKERQ